MKKDYLPNKNELAQEGQQKSAYDEIMDGILWVAEQKGKGEEAKKVYDRIKRRNAANAKRMREYLPKNSNEYNFDGKRYVEKIKKCSCKEMANGRYVLECNIHQRGRHDYEYEPGSDRLYKKNNKDKVLYLGDDAALKVKHAVERWESRVRKAGEWNFVAVPGGDSNILIRYRRIKGDEFEYCLEYLREGRRSVKIYENPWNSLHFVLRDVAEVPGKGLPGSKFNSRDLTVRSTKETIEENPVYAAAKKQGDKLFMKVLKLHYGISTKEQNHFLAKLFGLRILPNLNEEFDRNYVVDADTVDANLLHRSGYRMLHRPYFAMKGSTHSKITLNPHTKEGVDAAKDDEPSTSFAELLELFDNEENIE